jgi:hypothetical protein
MKILSVNSLAGTLDAINEAFFYGHKLTKTQKLEAAKWIASRRGKPGSYASMFAPTDKDFKRVVKVFTGESVRSNAATSHILGEEACRAMILLNVPDANVKNALNRANLSMLKRLREYETQWKVHGMYCCGICSASYWRNIVVGGLDKKEQRLAAGMKKLKTYRLGNGEWRRFPFFYTLLALNEIELKSAIEEMRYAAPLCERYLKRATSGSKYSQRRHDLAERILAKC